MKLFKEIIISIIMILVVTPLCAQGFDPNKKLSREDIKEIEKKAKKGDMEAMIGLAGFYTQGAFGVPKDPKKAYQWGKKAYEAGNMKGDPTGLMIFLTILVANQNEYPNADTEIRAWGARGELLNNPYALAVYGGWLLDKGEVNDGLTKLHKSAALGSPEAMLVLSNLYLGNNGVSPDYDESFKWAAKAAEFGNPQAMRNLAMMYANGLGMPKDAVKAVEWGEKAAAKGLDCTDVLINIYLSSSDFNQQKKGFDFIYALQNEPNPEIWQILGVCYENGIGTEKNEELAVQWYELASQGDNPNAKVRIASAKLNGELGMTQDIDGGLTELNNLCDQGIAASIYPLFAWYRGKKDGVGVLKCIDKAEVMMDQIPQTDANFYNMMRADVYADDNLGLKDLKKEVEYLKKVTNDNSSSYHLAQGVLLFDKKYGEPNYEKAIQHFEWIINDPNSFKEDKWKAYKKLSAAYRYGRGVEMNEVKADEYQYKSEAMEKNLDFEEGYVNTTELMQRLGL